MCRHAIIISNKGMRQNRRGKVRGRPGATSNQVRRGNENPTYATDGEPQPGASH